MKKPRVAQLPWDLPNQVPTQKGLRQKDSRQATRREEVRS